MKPPKYVKLIARKGLHSSALRYQPEEKNYYRDAGAWSVDYKYKKDGLYSVSAQSSAAHDCRLVTITKAEWQKDNEGYVWNLELWNVLEDFVL